MRKIICVLLILQSTNAMSQNDKQNFSGINNSEKSVIQNNVNGNNNVTINNTNFKKELVLFGGDIQRTYDSTSKLITTKFFFGCKMGLAFSVISINLQFDNKFESGEYGIWGKGIVSSGWQEGKASVSNDSYTYNSDLLNSLNYVFLSFKSYKPINIIKMEVRGQ